MNIYYCTSCTKPCTLTDELTSDCCAEAIGDSKGVPLSYAAMDEMIVALAMGLPDE